MNPRKYFPLGKAYGESFCNRVDEVNFLMGNVYSGKHTFLAAPRRYGKSSLCERVIEKLNLPQVSIDLHVATSDKAIERIILKGVVDLVGKAISPIEKAVQSIKYLFKNLKPKLSIEASGFKFELQVLQEASPPEAIREALLVLESFLKLKKQKAVLVIDEFQRVIEIAPDMGLEGGIRSAAQETEFLSLIFSGSNRHLIESIFHDEGRPLYKLCKKVRLDRISENHYRKHLNHAANQMWGKNLDDLVFNEIMHLTERHPYYVNYVCDVLWSSQRSAPKDNDVKSVWESVVNEERSDLLNEFYSLGENQKKLLIYLSSIKQTGIYTAEASSLMEMPTTSVPKALYALINKDMVEEYSKGFYRVINPAYKSILDEK